MDIKALGIKEITFNDIENIKIGHAVNEEAATGCSVLISEHGMPAAVDIRGGGPASRETPLLKPLASGDYIHAILLSGGSAFGLEASCGVTEFLESKGIGYDTSYALVPLVCQSCIYDLCVGASHIRPNKKMGYDACVDAYTNQHRIVTGNVGAGIGATVGKANGADFMMKSGLGMYAMQYGNLKVGAIVVVNALGDVYDCQTHRKIAGMLNQNKDGFEDCETALLKSLSQQTSSNIYTSNTTIGIVVTNAQFNKMQLQRVASASHNGYARTIRPIHTSADGDSIYAVSVGNVNANVDVVSSLATEAMARAVNNAVYSADEKYGLLAAKNFINQK